MGFLGTYASNLSDFSLILEILVTIAFLSGYRFAKKKIISKHYKTMITAFILDISFMVSYMVKSLIEGRAKFGGPENLKLYIYYPLVVFHSIISIVVLALVAYMIYHGFKNTKPINGRKMFSEKEKHHKIGRMTIIVWMLSFVSGIAIYFMLYVIFIPA